MSGGGKKRRSKKIKRKGRKPRKSSKSKENQIKKNVDLKIKDLRRSRK